MVSTLNVYKEFASGAYAYDYNTNGHYHTGHLSSRLDDLEGFIRNFPKLNSNERVITSVASIGREVVHTLIRQKGAVPIELVNHGVLSLYISNNNYVSTLSHTGLHGKLQKKGFSDDNYVSVLKDLIGDTAFRTLEIQAGEGVPIIDLLPFMLPILTKGLDSELDVSDNHPILRLNEQLLELTRS